MSQQRDPTATLIHWLRSSFLGYQLRWITEPARFALCNKGRQLGFSDATAAACLLGALRDRRPQIVLSAAQDNANSLIATVRAHCRFLAEVGVPEATDFAVCNTEEIAWRSGGSVIALAANPRTARSFHGDLWLDEFAYHQDADALWEAASPMATRGDWRVRVFSTPNGAQGLFYEWCSSHPKGWAFHQVSLDDAERDGLKVDRAALSALVNGDERVFGEAYLCRFLDADLQYVPTELADRALRWVGRAPDLDDAEFFAGLDVGRHHDLTVLTIVAVRDGVAWVVAQLTAKRTAFKAQRAMIAKARDAFPWRRLVVDKGGLGEQLAEELVELYGAHEVEPFAFSAPGKEKLATTAFRWLRDGRVRFPRGDTGKALHAETIAVRRKVTTAGTVTFESPRTKAGHGDRFWSFACALLAASAPALPRGIGTTPTLAIA